VLAHATSRQGAVVTYQVSAVGAAGGAVTVVCTPPSGSTFPVGLSRVECVATDSFGNTSRRSFFVLVVR
jgi:hypothetical protein